MKVTIAIDSFKGSLTSMEAGQAAADGIKNVYPDSNIWIRPLADGGEGTVEALTCGLGGELYQVQVMGPVGNPVVCTYGVIPESSTAVMEVSGAAGLTLLKEQERNPMKTTTYGVGEMIREAIQKGCRRFLIGIGGSATNDGGIGMMQALGFDMLDKNGVAVRFGAQGLEELAAITDTHAIPELKECSFRIACDVTNILCGSQGCSVVFGPQKGAAQAMIRNMDEWLASYAALAKERYPKADPKQPGAGAAGGLGFAFLTFLNAKLESGVKIILEETGLEDYVREADVVVTGEGRLDGQTVMGKAPIGVAKMAKKFGKPVVALAGAVTEDACACNEEGIDAFFPILRSAETLEEAMDGERAKQNLRETSEQVFRLIRACNDKFKN